MNAEEHFKRGVDCINAQDYDGAIADFTEVLRLNPDNVSSFHNRSGAWLEKGAFDEAIADYSKVLVDPVLALIGNGYQRGFAV